LGIKLLSIGEIWPYCSKSSKGLQKTMKGLEPLIGEAERAGSVQPGGEVAQGNLTNAYKCLTGDGVVKKMETDSSQ